MSENTRTLIFAFFAIIAAVLVGCLFGDSVRVMLGTNEDSAMLSDYSDRMSVIKAAFAEQSDPYQIAAMHLYGEDGLELVASRGEVVYVRSPDGSLTAASDYFAGAPELTDALDTLFFSTPEAVLTATDTNGEDITDLMLYNIKVYDDQVTFVLYYCEGGYLAIVYDNQDRIDSNMDIIRLSESNGQNYGWGIVTKMG